MIIAIYQDLDDVHFGTLAYEFKMKMDVAYWQSHINLLFGE